jgi:hypothetical protein
MDDELTPEQKFAAEDPETMVGRELSRGRDREEIVADLVRLDWSPAAAEHFIDRVEQDLRRYSASPESRQALLREARRDMLAGLAMTVVGVGILAVTFLVAVVAPFGVIVLSTGMATGVVVFLRGWSRWRLYRRDVLPFQSMSPAEEQGDESSHSTDQTRGAPAERDL